MAGDIVAFFGMNDKDFQQGVRRAAASAGSLSAKVALTGGEITKSFGKAAFGVQNIGMASFAAVGTAAGLAGKAVTDYGSINSQVAGDIASMGRATSTVWRDIGREISGVTGELSVFFVKMVKGFNEGRKAAADFVAKGLRAIGWGNDQEGSIGEVLAAQKATETFDANMKMDALIRKSKSELLRNSGQNDAAQIESIKIARDKALEELETEMRTEGGPLFAASEDRKNQMRSLIKANTDAQIRAIEDERDARAAADTEAGDLAFQRGIQDQLRASDAESERERAASNSQIMLGFETRRLEIDTLRLSGQQKEADLLDARLDAYRRIYEINRQTGLDEESRRSAIEGINRNLAARESSIVAEGERVSGVNGSLGVGFAGVRGLSSQVFGSGAQDQQTRQTKLQERMVRVLESIERKQGAGAAVFAP